MASVERSWQRSTATLVEDDAWTLLRALARWAREGRPVAATTAVALRGGELAVVPPEDACIVLRPGRGRGWDSRRDIRPSVAELLDLYVPLCVGERAGAMVVAHLGQSLDGRVAMPEGAPRLITGPEDIRHTHRMRALFDAVLVGAITVLVDDPQLTTRLVPGDQAVRVVLDPCGRVLHERRLFRDGSARTVVVVGREHAHRHAPLRGRVEVVDIELRERALPLPAVLEALGRLGIGRVFVEGGGITVSRFLDARLLHRLQVTVAPKIIGTGTPAIDLDGRAWLAERMAVESRRFLLGPDVLFDCELGRPRREAWEGSS